MLDILKFRGNGATITVSLNTVVWCISWTWGFQPSVFPEGVPPQAPVLARLGRDACGPVVQVLDQLAHRTIGYFFFSLH